LWSSGKCPLEKTKKQKQKKSIHTSQLPLTSEMPQEVVHCCVEGSRLSPSGSSRSAYHTFWSVNIASNTDGFPSGQKINQ
jgi:hypothetical protein